MSYEAYYTDSFTADSPGEHLLARAMSKPERNGTERQQEINDYLSAWLERIQNDAPIGLLEPLVRGGYKWRGDKGLHYINKLRAIVHLATSTRECDESRRDNRTAGLKKLLASLSKYVNRSKTEKQTWFQEISDKLVDYVPRPSFSHGKSKNVFTKYLNEVVVAGILENMPAILQEQPPDEYVRACQADLQKPQRAQGRKVRPQAGQEVGWAAGYLASAMYASGRPHSLAPMASKTTRHRYRGTKPAPLAAKGGAGMASSTARQQPETGTNASRGAATKGDAHQAVVQSSLGSYSPMQWQPAARSTSSRAVSAESCGFPSAASAARGVAIQPRGSSVAVEMGNMGSSGSLTSTEQTSLAPSVPVGPLPWMGSRRQQSSVDSAAAGKTSPSIHTVNGVLKLGHGGGHLVAGGEEAGSRSHMTISRLGQYSPSAADAHLDARFSAEAQSSMRTHSAYSNGHWGYPAGPPPSTSRASNRRDRGGRSATLRNPSSSSSSGSRSPSAVAHDRISVSSGESLGRLDDDSVMLGILSANSTAQSTGIANAFEEMSPAAPGLGLGGGIIEARRATVTSGTSASVEPELDQGSQLHHSRVRHQHRGGSQTSQLPELAGLLSQSSTQACTTTPASSYATRELHSDEFSEVQSQGRGMRGSTQTQASNPDTYLKAQDDTGDWLRRGCSSGSNGSIHSCGPRAAVVTPLSASDGQPRQYDQCDIADSAGFGIAGAAGVAGDGGARSGSAGAAGVAGDVGASSGSAGAAGVAGDGGADYGNERLGSKRLASPRDSGGGEELVREASADDHGASPGKRRRVAV